LAPLTARIETLEVELARLEATAAVHRAAFERERERCERLVANAWIWAKIVQLCR
jgi:hypothetical protein